MSFSRLTVLTIALLALPAVADEPAADYQHFTEMPQGVTSFGAAIADGYLYTYGGHLGTAHEYFKEDQSDAFRRLKLEDGAKWEDLPGGPRLQGLAMVAHGGKLYRIGGFSAQNSEDQAQDLVSSADVSCFDPETKEWEKLPSLPEPRSSHDAVVIGDKIYVAGGWKLQGKDGERVWHKSAYVMDLSQEPLKWETLPEPPFQRRALSVGELEGKVYVVGGIQPVGGISMEVDVYDPQTKKWSKAPTLPGEGVDGFGTSAFAAGGTLYVSNVAGKVYGLAPEADKWVEAGKLTEKRFFHRMLTTADGELLIVGGAEWLAGKTPSVYIVPLKDRTAAE